MHFSQQGSPGTHLTPSHWLRHEGPQFKFLHSQIGLQPINNRQIKSNIVNFILYLVIKKNNFTN